MSGTESGPTTGPVGEPHLTWSRPPRDPRAVALVLHGGRSVSREPTRQTQLAVLRMVPFASSLTHAGHRHGLAVARLRYRVRGWNGAERSPVADAAWALDRIAARVGPQVPVALVGHSMGGRTAVHSAAHPSVRTVVGLAPWIEAGDPTAPSRGRDVLFAHGDGDRTTSAAASAAFVGALQGVAASAAHIGVRGDAHALLRRPGLWHGLATGYVLATLLDVAPADSVGGDAAGLLDRALAGGSPVVG